MLSQSPARTLPLHCDQQQGDGSSDYNANIPSPGPAAAGPLHPPLHLGVMKAGVLMGMSSERWTRPELVATRPMEIIINLNRFCDQDTKCLGVAIKIIAWDGHG